MTPTEEKRPETPRDLLSKTGSPCIRRETAGEPESSRLAELEMENRRLNRLVAELVIKNHQLRSRS